MRTQVTGADLVDDGMEINGEVLAAVKTIARVKPWRGNVEERKAKFLAAATLIAEAGGFPPPKVEFVNVELGGCSGASYYDQGSNLIVLTGRLSVVTLLRLLGYASGMSVGRSTKWTINVFKRCFPISYSRCHFEGYMLRNSRAIII